MKTFKDLKFESHPHDENGLSAKIFFPNGYGASVVRFKVGGSYGSYTDNDNEWELAVLEGKEGSWGLCYTTPITNDVEGHLSEEDVSKMLLDIQQLPKIT